jgi:hypothetical protein
MTPEQVFQWANALAPLAWLAMILAPQKRWVLNGVLSGAAVAVLASVYFLVVLTHFDFSAGDFTSLAGVTALLSDPWAMTAGWIHYLAFDLLAGIIITKKGRTMGFTKWQLLPCQICTFMLGPVGVVLFVTIAKIKGHPWTRLAINNP